MIEPVDGRSVPDVSTLCRRWGRWRRLSDAEAHAAAEQWRGARRVRQTVKLDRINRHQVMDERGRRGCGLVGVVYNEETARICHTRALVAEDLVHELLHVAHPSWTEGQVVNETDRLLADARPARRRTVKTTSHSAAASSGDQPGAA
jgi:hypothetical protein